MWFKNERIERKSCRFGWMKDHVWLLFNTLIIFLWIDFESLWMSWDVHCICRAQTIIDILVRHAFDNRDKFTSIQKIVIEKLWASVREQQTRRKQGKSTTGKLDVTSFERLQDQYSREHISIRRAVGHGGGRSAEQWLGWQYLKSKRLVLVYVVRSVFPLFTPWGNSTSVLSVCASVDWLISTSVVPKDMDHFTMICRAIEANWAH